MRKRPVWQRIRYKRIAICALMVCVISTGTVGIYHGISREREAMKPKISYTLIPKKGDTLWDLCRNIDNEMDTGYLVWLAMEQNNLHSAYDLQPGKEIVITLNGK